MGTVMLPNYSLTQETGGCPHLIMTSQTLGCSLYLFADAESVTCARSLPDVTVHYMINVPSSVRSASVAPGRET